MAIKEGMCIKYNGEGYFYTNKTNQSYGNTYHIFCKMKPIGEITPFDFWGISERFLNEEIEKGTITIVEKFSDL